MLHRSSKNEWIADAKGFYWSDNNIKDVDVRRETIASVNERPSSALIYAPSKRDKAWLKLYNEGKGKIDADFARQILTTPVIDSPFAVDAKYMTADMAAGFETWASFGPPVNSLWEPSELERKKFPEIKPLIHNPWTILSSVPPIGKPATTPIDRKNLHKPEHSSHLTDDQEPAWHGTLRPYADADIWLTTAFANYEKIVASEKKMKRFAEKGVLSAANLEELGVEISFYRSVYAQGVRALNDFPLSKTKSSFQDDSWFNAVTGKGVLFLHTLRGIIGAEVFDKTMDEFGKTNAGKAVSSLDFEIFLQKKTKRNLAPLFNWWLTGTGLPKLSVVSAHAVRNHGQEWETTITLNTSMQGPALNIPITVEMDEGEVTLAQTFDASHSVIKIRTMNHPERVIVDKYGLTARSNGSPFTILTFDNELENTLIVYGTTDEKTGNFEAARILQRSLRRREHGVQPKIKSDKEITEEDILKNHLILIGRPTTNLLSTRFANQIPVKFGKTSFEIRDDIYAHEESAVIVAGENPLNPRYSVVVIAGLNSLSTYQLMQLFEEDVLSYAQVVTLTFGNEENAFVAPIEELSIALPPNKNE